ncbi:MAG: sulfite exporter TauE/SafE family protein [Cypionkella sp.]|nr:sulfite exporter TauE/SafE family protein [Cypionkella sp.]
MSGTDLALAGALLVGAVLYSSVGHGGASAYIAIMSLFGMGAGDIKPTALALNVLVASIASYRYVKAGQFDARLFAQVAIPAFPAAFLGGYMTLPSAVYNPIVGAVLIFTGLRFFLPLPALRVGAAGWGATLAKIAAGAGIGLLSGLTGTGGGIFLSPLVLMLGWATPKQASGVAALFILLNSASGLMGNISALSRLPDNLPLLGAAVVLGGLIGTSVGVRYFNNRAVAMALSAVLLVAGVKFLLT